MEIELDLSKATEIKGYPFYYIIEGKIWLYNPRRSDGTSIKKEIVPNGAGKIGMKNAEGKIDIFMYEDVLKTVENVVEQLKQKGLKPKKIVEPVVKEEDLDPELIAKRKRLVEKVKNLFNIARLTDSFEKLMEVKPLYEEAREDLAAFDLEFPDYSPQKKRVVVFRDQEHREMVIRVNLLNEEVVESFARIKAMEGDIVRLFGSLNNFFSVINGMK